jgi:hypothetical protein
MSIPAELRNARMMVNRGHGDVSDEPDPLHEAAADEIERLDRELEAREKTIERLRQELELLRGSIRSLFPENFPGPFICGHGGEERDGLPDLLHVCVSYGADWTVTYKRMPSTFTLEQECVEEIARLRAALEWYAGDGSTYDGIDVGQRAREALTRENFQIAKAMTEYAKSLGKDRQAQPV